jgi:hypothetical protein
MKNYTDQEAKEKWCPLIGGHCRGFKCMLFVPIREEVRYLPIKGKLNKEKTTLSTGRCSVSMSSIIPLKMIKKDNAEDD